MHKEAQACQYTQEPGDAPPSLMLRRFNHRFKNHLQTLSSMFSLQSRDLEQGARQALQQGQQRIQIIALVYDALSRSLDPEAVLLGECLKLSAQRSQTVSLTAEVRYDLEDVTLDPDRAVPLMLAANELITNSLRHAFEGVPDALLTISLRKLPTESARLLIADNGRGFDYDPDRTGFGLKLASILTKQIHGSLRLESRSTGTTASIDFPSGTK